MKKYSLILFTVLILAGIFFGGEVRAHLAIDLFVNPINAAPGDAITANVTVHSNSPPAGGLNDFYITWGDGSFQNYFCNPVPTGSCSISDTHIYTSENSYLIEASFHNKLDEYASDAKLIFISAVPPPNVNLTASPDSIIPGTVATLSWSSTNANSCVASQGWSGNKSTSGSETVSPGFTTTYTLTCSGTGGASSDSATITVIPGTNSCSERHEGVLADDWCHAANPAACEAEVHSFCSNPTERYWFGCKWQAVVGDFCICDPAKTGTEDCSPGQCTGIADTHSCVAAPACAPDGCNQQCPPGCTAADYPADLDCQAIDNDGCCASADPALEPNDCGAGPPPPSTNVCTRPIIPCGQVEVNPATGESYVPHPCQLCHVFELIINIINFLLQCLVPPIALIMLVIGALTIMFSGGSPGLQSRAKSILKSVIIGLFIVYGSWLLISAFLTVIGVENWTGLTNWFQPNICP